MQVINFDTQQQLDDILNADTVGVGAQSCRDSVVRDLTSGTPVIVAVGGLPLGALRYERGDLSMHYGSVRYSQLVASLSAVVAYSPDHIAHAIEGRLGVGQLSTQYPQVQALLKDMIECFDAWKEFTQQNPHASLSNPDAYSRQAAYINGLDQAYTRLLQAVIKQGNTD